MNLRIFNSKIQNINYFLDHPQENQAQMMGWHGWNSNFIIKVIQQKIFLHKHKHMQYSVSGMGKLQIIL